MKQALGMQSPARSSIWPVAIPLFLVAFLGHANNMLDAPLLTKVAQTIGTPIEDLGYLVTVYDLTMGYEYSTYGSAMPISASVLLIARGMKPQEQPAK